MPRPIHVHFVPALFTPDMLAGGTAVVIDVLRASTTVCHALHAGADRVVPCGSVEDARETAAALRAKGEAALLGGERMCVKVDGFDLGNSPVEYTAETVGGKPVVLTTTNGTAALFRCLEAREVLVGSFANLSALCERLAGGDGRVNLVCAGTDRNLTAEDALFAGRVANRLVEAGSGTLDHHDADPARLAATFATANPETAAVLHDSRGGRNLARLGRESDIEVCAAADSAPVVPRLTGDALRPVS
ncbi:2-phosphosulfolactate phosphatase [Alienimonas chondri]|uniref:Probable 2-phosphosulfolactate phosphatase n=1 Tax=Alienimonas chondri TaxID=2681879 RepID=A0ABX1V9M8_9PLAN|nr:2-phosphosulfolactate phosphatase [Alienimonas chondri]NNJ24156.1 putative 2-phosphosulfolactate phosphatase [Alienimonas chondri]